MKLICKIKNYRLIFIIVLFIFSVLFVSGCKLTSTKTTTTTLTVDNYSDYLTVTSYTGGGSGTWNFWMPHCFVDIRKVSDSSSFQNVAITYKFKLYDAEHTIDLEKEFTEPLGELKNNYSKSFELRFDHTNGNFPPNLYTTVEVLEISGTNILIKSHSNEKILTYIGIGFLFALCFGLLLFFPINASIFSKKFSRVTNGMKYDEVLNLLGEPNESRSAKGITTCIWKRAILRGWSKTYILTFEKGAVILDMEHTNWC